MVDRKISCQRENDGERGREGRRETERERERERERETDRERERERGREREREGERERETERERGRDFLVNRAIENALSFVDQKVVREKKTSHWCSDCASYFSLVPHS